MKEFPSDDSNYRLAPTYDFATSFLIIDNPSELSNDITIKKVVLRENGFSPIVEREKALDFELVMGIIDRSKEHPLRVHVTRY